MKKTISLLIFSIMISTGKKMLAQKLSGNCPQQALVREFCKAGDTLARFMDDIKKTSTENQWSKFISDGSLGTVAAFNNFGERANDLRNNFTRLGNNLDQQTINLITAVDPVGALPGEQLRDQIVSLINCYYADTVENNIKKLMAEGGGPIPQVLAGGPCEITARNCASSASATYHNQLINCGLGSGGIIKFISGWLGGIGGLLCFASINYAYNNAKMNCFYNYIDCLQAE